MTAHAASSHVTVEMQMPQMLLSHEPSPHLPCATAGSLDICSYMSMISFPLTLWEGHPAHLSLEANTSMPLVIPDCADEHNIPSVPWCHTSETQICHDLQSQQCPLRG